MDKSTRSVDLQWLLTIVHLAKEPAMNLVHLIHRLCPWILHRLTIPSLLS
jgi:ribosomal protein L32